MLFNLVMEWVEGHGVVHLRRHAGDMSRQRRRLPGKDGGCRGGWASALTRHHIDRRKLRHCATLPQRSGTSQPYTLFLLPADQPASFYTLISIAISDRNAALRPSPHLLLPNAQVSTPQLSQQLPAMLCSQLVSGRDRHGT